MSEPMAADPPARPISLRRDARLVCAALAIAALMSCGDSSNVARERNQVANMTPASAEPARVTPAPVEPVNMAWAVGDSGSAQAQDETIPRGRIFGRPIVTHAGRLVVGPDTQISVETILPPSLVNPLRLSVGSERGLSNLVTDAIAERLRRANRPQAIFALPGSVSAAAGHIVVTQEVSLNREGRPYLITLTARQGARRWSAKLERPFMRQIAGGVPISPDGTTSDGRPYWHVVTDSQQLADRLRDTLVLRRASR